jgi:tRNA splicing ligase
MIYIEINTNNEVITQHRYPFDEKYGYGKTKEELQQIGFLVESISEAERIEGKEHILKYDPNTKTLYYEYIENTDAVNKEKIDFLEKQVADLTFMIMQMQGGTN